MSNSIFFNDIKTSNAFAAIRKCGVISNAIGSAFIATPIIVGVSMGAIHALGSIMGKNVDWKNEHISEIGAVSLLGTFVVTSVFFTKYLFRLHRISVIMEKAGLAEKDYNEKRDLLPASCGCSPPALVVAISNHHSSDKTIEIVLNILHAGAYIDERDREGNTALSLAAQYNYLDIVRMLIQKGASIRYLRYDHYSKSIRREIIATVILQYLPSHTSSSYPLQNKNIQSHPEVVSRLVTSYLL